MECHDCRLPIDEKAHHDHGRGSIVICCDCFDEEIGRHPSKRRHPRPIVKPAALLIRDKKFLVARTQGKSHFYAVGGKLEPGETDIQCLHREVMEEIGCHITSERYYRTFVGPSADNQKTVVMICFFVELDREPTPSSEIEELLWADSRTTKDVIGSLLHDYVIPALKTDNLVN